MRSLPAFQPKLVRYRFDDRTIERLPMLRWRDFDLADISGLNFRKVGECLSRLEEIRTGKDGVAQGVDTSGSEGSDPGHTGLGRVERQTDREPHRFPEQPPEPVQCRRVSLQHQLHPPFVESPP